MGSTPSQSRSASVELASTSTPVHHGAAENDAGASKSESHSEIKPTSIEPSTSEPEKKDGEHVLVEHENDLQDKYDNINDFACGLKESPLLETDILEKLAIYEESQDDMGKLADHLSTTVAADVINALYKSLLASFGVSNMAFITPRMAEENAYCVHQVHLLRDIVCNNTGVSPPFAEKVCKTGLLEQFVEELQHVKISKETDDTTIKDSSFYMAIEILLNCSKNPAVRQSLRSYNTVNCLMPFLKYESPVLKLTVLMTLAYLVDEEENEMLLTDNKLFDTLLDLLRRAWKDKDHRCFEYSAELLIDGMRGLAKNDKNKLVISEKGAVVDLILFMQEGSEMEVENAVNCIWELAFKIKEEMKLNDELIGVLTKLKTSSRKSISESAEGALWVINQDKKPLPDVSETTITQPVKEEPTDDGHVMISYNWEDQETVLKIKQSLVEKGYTVWIDVDNMLTGSNLEAMAQAVEDAAVVLICMSERYKLSANCRSEAEFAFAKRKTLIPLMMQRNYRPDGWLGLVLGAQLYVDFTGKYSYDRQIDWLLKELRRKGPSVTTVPEEV